MTLARPTKKIILKLDRIVALQNKHHYRVPVKANINYDIQSYMKHIVINGIRALGY